MDNLTHTAVGLFLARAGFNRWTPRAAAVSMIAANAPDIDVVSWLGGTGAYLRYHRHWTHSLLAMPLMAAASVALVWALGRKPLRWPGALALAMVAVASHLLLDWTNVYGIRLLLPFSGEWLRLDTTNVVDLWIWTAALLGVAAPLLARLVGSEITSKSLRPKHHGRTAAILVLLFIVAYNFGRGVLHARAVATLDSRIYEGAQPRRVAAIPGFANPVRWRGLVETRDFYAVADVSLTEEFDPSRALIFQKPEVSPAMEAAGATPAFRSFLQFSQFPLWRVLPTPEPENGRQVDVIDMRFGTPAAPGFMVTAILDSELRVVRTAFQVGAARAAKVD